jgi:hypothetical protein
VGTCFGITGAALTNSGQGINDLDLVMIAPDSVARNGSGPIVLPQRFASRAWNSYLVHFASGTTHVYVTHCPQNTKIRLEFYPLCIAEKILCLDQFAVRRVGQNPLSSAPRSSAARTDNANPCPPSWKLLMTFISGNSPVASGRMVFFTLAFT